MKYKKELRSVKPNKKFNYAIYIYTKWYRHYFYFCEKYKAVFESREADEFEIKFVRIEFIGENNFNFSYFRHTGQWHMVMKHVSLMECLEMMNENPNFQPLF